MSHQDVVDIQEDQNDGVGRMQVVQAAIMFTLFEAEGDESGVNLIIPELATTLGAVEAFEKTVRTSCRSSPVAVLAVDACRSRPDSHFGGRRSAHQSQ